MNGVNDNQKGSTALATVRRGKEALTAWELPKLIRPMPVRQHSAVKRPRLLAHYPALVEFVYKHRFATAAQIERRFPTYLPAHRTTQYQLAALVQLGYLQTAPVRSTSPNFPFVYSATGRGVRLVVDTYQQLGISWQEPILETRKQKGIALASILHELLLTELELAVWKTAESRGDLDCLFTERRYFQREKQLYFEHQGRRQLVIPDAGFLLNLRNKTSKRLDVSSHPTLLLHFVEMDNGTMPLRRILKKFQSYDLWARSEEGQAQLYRILNRYDHSHANPNFRLLVVVHDGSQSGGDYRRLTNLLMQTIYLPSAMRDRIWFTTIAQIRREKESPTPLSAPLWLRARDIKTWLHLYRHFIGYLSSEGSSSSWKRHQEFIAQKIQTMPLHSLFSTLNKEKA